MNGKYNLFIREAPRTARVIEYLEKITGRTSGGVAFLLENLPALVASDLPLAQAVDIQRNLERMGVLTSLEKIVTEEALLQVIPPAAENNDSASSADEVHSLPPKEIVLEEGSSFRVITPGLSRRRLLISAAVILLAAVIALLWFRPGTKPDGYDRQQAVIQQLLLQIEGHLASVPEDNAQRDLHMHDLYRRLLQLEAVVRGLPPSQNRSALQAKVKDFQQLYDTLQKSLHKKRRPVEPQYAKLRRKYGDVVFAANTLRRYNYDLRAMLDQIILDLMEAVRSLRTYTPPDSEFARLWEKVLILEPLLEEPQLFNRLENISKRPAVRNQLAAADSALLAQARIQWLTWKQGTWGSVDLRDGTSLLIHWGQHDTLLQVHHHLLRLPFAVNSIYALDVDGHPIPGTIHQLSDSDFEASPPDYAGAFLPLETHRSLWVVETPESHTDTPFLDALETAYLMFNLRPSQLQPLVIHANGLLKVVPEGDQLRYFLFRKGYADVTIPKLFL